MGRRLLLTAIAATLVAGSAGMVLAQADQTGGVVPAADSGSFEVDGVQVDVSAKDSQAAREGGWRLAQRKAWRILSQRLGGSGALVSDGTLNALVTGIVVENEEIGPDRYIARLGVMFDRQRAGDLLGVPGGGLRSQPMLVVPLEWTGGVGEVFEQQSDWQQAWARFHTGNSDINYLRPTGNGPDALLLNAGQVGRRGRGWWRTILDQYGALDVLIPTVTLYRQYPGGPVIGVFEARYGPDDVPVQRFVLRVNNADGLPALLDAGVKRIDQAYQDALKTGVLQPDPGLAYVAPAPTPTPTPDADQIVDLTQTVPAPGQGATVSIQFETPSAAAVPNTEGALRGLPGVVSATTTSLALGGMSVMRVVYQGDPQTLAQQLRANGWQVEGSGTTLRIARGATPTLPTPTPPSDDATTG